MATTKKTASSRPASGTARARPSGPHQAVSNEPDERAAEAQVRRAVSKPPAEGSAPRISKPGPDGAEAVAGFKLLQESDAAETEAPDTEGLPDIGEASFGPPPPPEMRARTVHGPDNRVRINNTADYPWRVHASLLITAADNSQWIGTGWFIGPRTLVTAGHVVYIKNSGVAGRDGWVKSIRVMPGRNGSTLPFGSVTSTSFRSVSGWTSNGDQNFDYGAILLSTDLGNRTGWFGFGVYSDADLQASVGNISGYPGDQPSGTQWYDARRIASVSSRKVHYDIDTFGGQSGSAVYRIVNGGRYGFAIHAYGGAVTNSGTRIITAVYNNLVAWRS